MKKSDAEPLLQLPHGVAQSRGRNAKPHGRGTKTKVRGNGNERGQIG
jgi:hypothetical protein